MHQPLLAGPSPVEVRAMFSGIAPRYALMNTLMTFGLDGWWRRAAARLAEPAGARVLDVGAGSGDLARAVLRAGARQVVALDFTLPMLARACRAGGPACVGGDALALPFSDASFDRVVSGMTLRNLADLPRAFAEMRRVLRPGGRIALLELTHPPAWAAPAFWLYFGGYVPLLGAVVARAPAAYRYLPASLRRFPDAEQLANLLRQAGFTAVRFYRLFPGAVAVHVAERPLGPH